MDQGQIIVQSLEQDRTNRGATPSAVFLRGRRGEKRPIAPGWRNLSLGDMTRQYLASFNGDNIGVSMGSAHHNIDGH
jgi:hypothetical protein